MTREELLREWDLDGDGTISKPEADVARGRMRRKRLEMQFGAGIDPLTGLPRGIDDPAGEAGEGDDDELVFRLPPELPPVPRPRDDAAPGVRPPTIEPTAPRVTAPERPTAPGRSLTPAAAGLPTSSSRASWLPPQQRPPALTGGVRAGAPAAVPGYGAGPWSDLNAGRRPASPLDSGPRVSSGGLLPTARPPGRTGAILLPSIPGPVRGQGPTATPAAPVPVIPRPQITAEEIGGYRP